MAKKQLISVSETTRAQLEALAGLDDYRDMSAVVAAAVAELHRRAFPAQYDVPSVLGWDAFLTAQAMVCSETGRTIPPGVLAYREVWSDRREGAIVSRESLLADGVIDA